MTARITFRCEIFIEGDTISEINEKYGNMPLFCIEALESGADVIETLSVENAETHKEIDLWADDDLDKDEE